MSENNIEPVNCDTNETNETCLDIGNSQNSVGSQKASKSLNKTSNLLYEFIFLLIN